MWVLGIRFLPLIVNSKHLSFKKTYVGGEVSVYRPPVLLPKKGCRVKLTNQTSARQNTLNTGFIFTSIFRQYSVHEYFLILAAEHCTSQLQMPRYGGIYAMLKQQQPCPPDSGKLIKLSIVKDLPFATCVMTLQVRRSQGFHLGQVLSTAWQEQCRN